MARLAILVASAALVSACGSSSPSSPTPPHAIPTRLRIAVLAQGPGGGVRHYRLRCAPPAGTVPDPARACHVLAALAQPFAPTPSGTTCSDIALGPQQAVVSGVLHGARVHTRLRVQDSCEIERWRRVAAVVPGFPRTS